MKRLFLFSFLILFVASCSKAPQEVTLQWSEAEPLPVEITNNAVASAQINGEWHLFTFLGLEKGKTHEDLNNFTAQYNTGTETWETLPGVPDDVGRIASSAEYVNGYIYIFGGHTLDEDGNETSTEQVFKYNPVNKSYETVADMLLPVEDAVSLVYQDRYIYLVSGWNNTNNVSNVQVYDTETNSWSHAAPYPGPPVFGHSGGIIGNTMILSDGVQHIVDEGERIFVMSPGSIKGEIDPDNPAKITWTRIKQHPGTARYRMAAIGIEEPVQMVVFVGGSQNPYNYNGIGYNLRPSVPDSTVFAYRLDTEEWVNLGTQPYPTMDHRGIARGGNDYYIIGGMNDEQRVLKKVQKFSVKMKTVQ